MKPFPFLVFCALGLPSAVPAVAQPTWWATRALVSGQADDYAVANLGQLKTMAMAASVEMNLRLPAGAGTNINNLVTSWCQPAAIGVARDDYAVLTQGQLKYVASLYYSQLGLALPWTSATSDDDDYAAANLGQLKYVFKFQIAATGDLDADGLLDNWELSKFNNSLTAQAGPDDPDGDSLSNRAEFLVGSSPLGKANSGYSDVAALGLVVYSP